jgi:hypothetical protein
MIEGVLRHCTDAEIHEGLKVVKNWNRAILISSPSSGNPWHLTSQSQLPSRC